MTLHSWGVKWNHCLLTQAAHQRWKMEEWWWGNASWCPSSVSWADHLTLRQALPAACPIFPTTCFCCWKILNQFWLTASCSQCFPLQHWNVMAGKEEKQPGINSRQDIALKLHHFPELLLTWLRSHPDLWEMWLTLCLQLNESETVRQGLNSPLSSRKSFLVLWLGYEEQAQLVCFGCKSW